MSAVSSCFRVPTGGGGFEHFYGFIGGEANQWYPSLYEGTTPVEPRKTPEEGYHLMEDMTEKAIDWIGQQKALTPDKPFFVYFAPGATHAPHHVPKEWADKYKGKVRSGLGQVARGDLRPAENNRCDSTGLSAHSAAQRNPYMGRNACRAQARAHPAGFGLQTGVSSVRFVESRTLFDIEHTVRCGFFGESLLVISFRLIASHRRCATISQLRSQMENHLDGIWIIDADAKTAYANERMAEILGTSPSEMVGRASFAYVFPEDVAAAQRLFEAKIRGDKKPFHFRLRREDGWAVWVDVQGTPMHNAAGVFRGIVGTFSVFQKLETPPPH